MITGKSERYWTAVFLDEDFADDVPKLSVEEEEDVMVGGIDPIIVDAEFRSADTIVSPRAYALAALAATLEGIAEHHTYIQEEFAASLSRHVSSCPLSTAPRDVEVRRKSDQAETAEPGSPTRDT